MKTARSNAKQAIPCFVCDIFLWQEENDVDSLCLIIVCTTGHSSKMPHPTIIFVRTNEYTRNILWGLHLCIMIVAQ